MPRKKRPEYLPRPARSPFVLFAGEKRKLLRESNPDISFVEMANQLGAMWRALSPESKQRYGEDAVADRIRFEAEKRDYETNPHTPELSQHRRRKRRDPRLPKMPSTAYVFFCHDFRLEILRQHPNLSFCDFGRLAGLKWGVLTQEQRSIYESRAKQDNHRYNREMESYRKIQDGVQRNSSSLEQCAYPAPIPTSQQQGGISEFSALLTVQRTLTEDQGAKLQPGEILSATDESENEAVLGNSHSITRHTSIDLNVNEQQNTDMPGGMPLFLSDVDTTHEDIDPPITNYNANLTSQFEFSSSLIRNRSMHPRQPNLSSISQHPHLSTYEITPLNPAPYFQQSLRCSYTPSELSSLAQQDDLINPSAFDMREQHDLDVEAGKQFHHHQERAQEYPLHSHSSFVHSQAPYSSTRADLNDGTPHNSSQKANPRITEHNALKRGNSGS